MFVDPSHGLEGRSRPELPVVNIMSHVSHVSMLFTSEERASERWWRERQEEDEKRKKGIRQCDRERERETKKDESAIANDHRRLLAAAWPGPAM